MLLVQGLDSTPKVQSSPQALIGQPTRFEKKPFITTCFNFDHLVGNQDSVIVFHR
jgi:hypothetical protein